MLFWDVLSFVWRHPLNADGRIAAVGRVLRWQAASRLLRGPIALPFVEDTCLLASRGEAGATGNWYCGLHEMRDMAFVLHALRPGDRFLDVGANIGSYTVLAAGGVGASVTSVEPIPSTFERLRRNVAFNGLADRVRAIRCGLSDAPGTLRFTSDLDPMNHVLRPGDSGEGIEVSVRELDEVVGDEIPVLIKIDVEGFERFVLRGAARTLADRRLLAAIIEIGGDVPAGAVDTIQDTMRGYGFEAAGYDPFARRLTGASDGDANVIFVRDRAEIERRVSASRRYRLINGEI
jgi:FkbM family methyltransferase